MIGHLIDAYCLGRQDAAAGRRARLNRGGREGYSFTCYRQGWKDETKRMSAARRYPQLELELDTEAREGAQAPGR